MLGSRLRTSDTTPTQPQYCPPSAPQTRRRKKVGLRLYSVTPHASMCRRQDLNLHWVNPNQALNLARLPIPPLRRGRLSLYLMRMLPWKSSPNPARLARKKVREAEGDFGLPDWVEGRG